MPQAWNKKDERKYQHIKKSSQDRGKSEKRAKEIAARTVNKDRRERGDVQSKTSRATGNPNTPYEERTRVELMNLARKYDIEGRSNMKKEELIRALKKVN